MYQVWGAALHRCDLISSWQQEGEAISWRWNNELDVPRQQVAEQGYEPGLSPETGIQTTWTSYFSHA